MTKSLQEIQKENRKFILEAIYGCSYDEIVQKEVNHNYNHNIDALLYALNVVSDKKERIADFLNAPLTLSRVLLALKSKEDLFNPKRYEICLGTTRLFYYNYLKNIELVLDLTKETLEEQSEETQRGVNKLLVGI